MADPAETIIDLGENEVATEVEVGGEEVSTESQPETEIIETETSVSEEQEEYQSSVQRRIDKLTKRMRESERREQAAVEYAQNVQNESNALKTRMKALDEGYLNEYGGRITSEQEGAENALRSAMELGDTDATVAAQKKLTELAVAQERLNQAKTQQAQYQQQIAQQQQIQQQQQEAAAQQPVQPPPEADPKAEAWAARNEWFGKDEALTFAAFGLHKKLVEDEQFDPTSDEYYSELDKRMRNEFPQKLNGGTKKPSQTVASVSRSGSPGRSKKVRLTPSQVAIAKKLGVPLEEYAKYVKE
jgi:hypothetical protein